MHNRFDQRLGMTLTDCFCHVGVAGHERHAYTRLCEIHDDQPDGERGGGDDLEVNDRFNTHAPDFS